MLHLGDVPRVKRIKIKTRRGRDWEFKIMISAIKEAGTIRGHQNSSFRTTRVSARFERRRVSRELNGPEISSLSLLWDALVTVCPPAASCSQEVYGEAVAFSLDLGLGLGLGLG